MVKFVIDLATPKQVCFFRKFYEELTARGHDVTLVARHGFEVDRLVEYYKLPANFIGEHNSGGRYLKAYDGIERTQLLLNLFDIVKPDALITLCNPESTHAAYRLGTKIFCFCDIPEATHACKLTLPLATKVYAPFFARKELQSRHHTERLFTYNAFDQCLYMPDKPNKEALTDFGLSETDERNFLLFRQCEIGASYYNNPKDVATRLSKIFNNYKQVYLPHYEPHPIGDLHSLLAFPLCFVGGGGTMNIEAIWWNTPTISTRPLITCYDEWLIDRGLMLHADDVEKAKLTILNMMNNMERYAPDGSIIRNMEFPLKEICDDMEEVVGK